MHSQIITFYRTCDAFLQQKGIHDDPQASIMHKELPLPEGAVLYGDKAYTDYAYEADLQTDKKITLRPIRKGNHKRQHTKEVAKQLSHTRKRIETTFGQIAAKLPRRIHGVITAGFESKGRATFVAFAIACAENEKRANKTWAAS